MFFLLDLRRGPKPDLVLAELAEIVYLERCVFWPVGFELPLQIVARFALQVL